ncbi:MAG: AbrB family transcriptional regulator [Ahrensia sp.]|nr:AbrB family transcriptional regulator [Ahrensia sp.]|tara:strand:+ start:3058 stop:3342 length:285 start_codon:yes stop_codon:yes gene_type:complete
MGAYTTMTSKGQLTIPKDVREQLSLKPGTRFYVTVLDGRVVALPKTRRLADLAGMLGKPPSGETLSIEQMDEAIMDAVTEDDERIKREWNEAQK